MNPEKIDSLYKEFSEHFGVPMPEWKILPKPKIPGLRIQSTVTTPFGFKVRSIVIHDFRGRFVEEPKPTILFFGVPILKTALHEFMHYLVYCAKKEREDQ